MTHLFEQLQAHDSLAQSVESMQVVKNELSRHFAKKFF